ncbi:MAG: ATP-binding cassette domain-containing protein [Simkania sp.]|nr:ATP-binding cassette domain-containing protein [Simkania sp.]
MSDKKELFQMFRQLGAAEHLLPGEMFSLHREETVFAFERGSIWLYIRKEGEPQHLLAHLTDGVVFTSKIFDSSYEIRIISDKEITLFALSSDQLSQILVQHKELQKNFEEVLHDWIEALFSSCALLVINEAKCPISPEETLLLSPGQILVASKEWVWIETLEENLFLFENPELSIKKDELFPLTSSCWVTCETKSNIRAIDPLTLIEQNRWRRALENASYFFVQHFSVFIQQQQQRTWAARSDFETQQFNSVLKQMGTVFVEPLVGVLHQAEEPLEQACLCLSEYLNIQCTFPRNTKVVNDIEQRLDQICEASHIHYRKVKIVEQWWKQDHGPLLGFYGPEKTPVALLPCHTFRATYQIFDRSGKTFVSAENAHLFSPSAFMFYAPFNASVQSGKEVIHSACRIYAKPWKAILLFSLLGGGFALFPSIATYLLFSHAIREHSQSLIEYLALGLGVSAIGLSFFYCVRGFLFLKIEGFVTHYVQCGLWDRLLRLSPRFFRRFSAENIFSRVEAIENIRKLGAGNSATLCLNFFFSLLYLFVMFLFSPEFSFLAIGCFILALIITRVCCVAKIAILKRSMEIQGESSGIAVQMVQGIQKLRVAGAENLAFAHWASLFTKNKVLQIKLQHLQNIVVTMTAVLPILSMWLIYLALYFEWIRIERISIAEFLAFNIAYGSFMLAVYPACNILMQLVEVFPLWERANIILAEPVEASTYNSQPKKLSGYIRMEDVVFSYNPNHPPLFNKLSFSISPGEFIGIVGRSGSGKSTLVRLLLKFEELQSGVIYFDDADLSSLDLQAVRRQMGVVLQGEGMIFAGTLYENIICGGSYSPEEIQKAIALSGFDRELELLPMRLFTVIQANGPTLSEGQKQRLLLARAFLSNPSILILDEATSALDNQSQDRISLNVENLSMTRIVIAQRLNTVKKADRIYVLDKGNIIASGTFKELSKLPGIFSEMLARQQL